MKPEITEPKTVCLINCLFLNSTEAATSIAASQGTASPVLHHLSCSTQRQAGRSEFRFYKSGAQVCEHSFPKTDYNHFQGVSLADNCPSVFIPALLALRTLEIENK